MTNNELTRILQAHNNSHLSMWPFKKGKDLAVKKLKLTNSRVLLLYLKAVDVISP